MMLFTKLGVALFFIILNVNVQARVNCPIVRITEGEIQGLKQESRNGRDFCSYRGIPYASPPVAHLRFEPPESPQSWTGVKIVDKYGSRCVQYDKATNGTVGDEDCLFLNVFSPLFHNKFSPEPLPVMIYIHGGYFMLGEADSARPHYFMDEDVVVVSLNYRLRFLNTEDGQVRGNVGLKDQVKALKWVQKNIKEFGGDPAKVTIFGFSAGGSSVHYHLLSPMSRGLFHKGVSESSIAIKVGGALQINPREVALHLAKLANCETIGSNGVSSVNVTCLKSLSASDIGKVYSDTTSPLKNKLLKLGPSIEVTDKDQDDTFLTEHPFSIMVSGRQSKLPWMFGTNSEEALLTTGAIKRNPDLVALVGEHWDDFSGAFLQYNPFRTDLTSRIRNFFLPTDNPTNKTIDFLMKFTEFTHMFTDRLYAHASYEAVLLQAKLSPVYAYYNNYQGVFSFGDAFVTLTEREGFIGKRRRYTSVRDQENEEPKHLGVCHGDLFVLLFNFTRGEIGLTHKDYEMSRDLVNLWVQFAKNEESMEFRGNAFLPANPVQDSAGEIYDVMKFANLVNETGMVPHPNIERMWFWKSLEYLPPYQE